MCRLFIIVFITLLIWCLCESTTPLNRYSCPLVKLTHGRVRYRQKSRFIKYQCNNGYILAGERYSSCIKNKWDNPAPVCVRPTCPKGKPFQNGQIYPLLQGAVLNFYCKPSFSLRGNNMSYCDGFKWSSNLPTCIESDSEPANSCNFESEDLCGWTHDLNHDFDWIRQNFKTPSGHIGTGPSYDHTKGVDQDGYYVYIESSSRLENDTARLLSPIYNKMENGFCFTFYYHMYGLTVGQLKVYVKKENDSYNTKTLKPLFWEVGNQGNIWRKGVIVLDRVDQQFQIIIEGIRGSKYTGDIAIDDVELTESCPEEIESTSTTMDDSSTTSPLSYQSCLDRCENETIMDFDDNFTITCDCVDSCLEKNTCCPDYTAICVLGATDDFTDYSTTQTDEMDSTTLKTTPTTKSTTKLQISTANVTKSTTKILPTNATTKKIIIIPVITNVTKVNTTLKAQLTTLKPPIKNITKIIKVDKRNNEIPKEKKTSKVAKPKTTPYNFMTKVTKNLPTKLPIESEDATQETLEIETDFLATAPYPKTSDEIPQNDQQMSLSKDIGSHTANTKLILGVICSLAFVMLAVLSVAFAVKRYDMRWCSSGFRSYKGSHRSSSFSDVRFLASDEMLDFSIRQTE